MRRRFGGFCAAIIALAFGLGANGCKKEPAKGSQAAEKTAAMDKAPPRDRAARPSEERPAPSAMGDAPTPARNDDARPAGDRPAPSAGAEGRRPTAARDEPRHRRSRPRDTARKRPRKAGSAHDEGTKLGVLVGNTPRLAGSPKGMGASGGGSGTWGGFGPSKPGSKGGGLGGMTPKVRAKVRLSGASVAGGLSKSVVKRVLRRHLASVKYCYVTRGLSSNPKMAGRVTIAFSIAATGRVSMASVRSSTLSSSSVAGCVRSSVRRAVFPKPQKMTMGTASYSFKPQ